MDHNMVETDHLFKDEQQVPRKVGSRESDLHESLRQRAKKRKVLLLLVGVRWQVNIMPHHQTNTRLYRLHKHSLGVPHTVVVVVVMRFLLQQLC